MDRRRSLKTIFCSSAALSLNLRGEAAEDSRPKGKGLHLFAIGDFGTSGKEQLAVASAMRQYITEKEISPDALLLLGDNIYSRAKDGFSTESIRWKNTFEDVYPKSAFSCKAPAVLGNHDYHDNIGGEKIQLDYSKTKNTRYHLPEKWYRLDLGSPEPLVTLLALDSNLPDVSGRSGKPSLTSDEVAAQHDWFRRELEKPRAPFTIVMAHHPVYSNGSHGDTKGLHQAGWADLLEKHGVHLYLCGHDHDLQHLELEDLKTSFVLSGGGGANLRQLKPKRKVPYARDFHGFTHLEISTDKAVISHRNKHAKLLHRFTKNLDFEVELDA